MGLEVLRRKIDEMTLGQTKLRKEQRVKEHFAKWSHGGAVLSLPQFRMALSDLGVPARAAADMFGELDQARRGSIDIQQVISSVVPAREVPEHPLQHVRAPMQDSRSSSMAELGRPQELQMPPQASQAPSVPSSPAGIGHRASLDAEALKERKIRGFWDLIGSRAAEKGFKSVAQLLKAMDKDASGQLDRMEARRFFKVTLCLAISKADEFFSLLDDDRDGKVSCREISRCLAPYLEKNYRPDDEDTGAEAAARAERAREQELRKYWELIGNRAFDKGFKSAGQLMLQIDKDDDGLLDRKEMRTFLTNYAGFSQSGADHFFDLLDAENRGRVSSKEIRRRLEPYFQKNFRDPSTIVPDWRSSAEGVVSEQEDRQQELKKFWHLIGTKFFERGYRSAGQVLLSMDKDDSNFVDRQEIRAFFLRHLGHGQNSADRFFDLLDANGQGEVSCRAIAQCLAPYFQSTFKDPDEMVSQWEAPAQAPPSQPAPAGRASFGGSGGGASTPGRPGMRRHASMPGWAPQGAQGGVRESLGGSGGGAGGGPSPAPLAAPAAPAKADGSQALFEEQGSRAGSEQDHLSRSRPRELGPPRRGTLVAEEAPLPAARGPPAVGSQARERQAPPPAPPPQFQPPPRSGPAKPAEGMDLSAAVLAEFRRVILERNGAHGIHQFGRTFRIMDTDGNMAVSAGELDVALRRFGLNLKKKDLALLMSAVDEDGSGNISCTEFLKAVRGPVCPRRQQLIDVAFDCLDRNRNGQLEVNDIQHLYDVSQHPEVLNRTMTQDVALEHFLSQFEGVHHDGVVTRKEFSEYYANISASIDDDDHFEQLMRNAWRTGRSWPHKLSGRPLKARPEADDFVAPRPRRAAMWSGGAHSHH